MWAAEPLEIVRPRRSASSTWRKRRYPPTAANTPVPSSARDRSSTSVSSPKKCATAMAAAISPIAERW